ncbi:MAG: hypothetical protein R3F59_26840 [Myxococcota bacterium]
MHRLALPLLVALGSAGIASAATNDLEKAANHASYEVKETTMRCSGNDCSVYVINDKGVGVKANGHTKKGARENGKKKADELNEEAKEGTVSTEEDGVVDTCHMFPEMC